MYLMTSTRFGISAKQLERELGVTYRQGFGVLSIHPGSSDCFTGLRSSERP